MSVDLKWWAETLKVDFSSAEQAYLRELEEIRKRCGHPEVVEYDSGKEPMRICTTCGAEDTGWGVGWTGLTVEGDWRGTGEHRTLIEVTKDRKRFARHRHPVGGRYLVGDED